MKGCIYMSGPAYSEAEIQLIRTLWPKATRPELLAALPNRTWESMQHQAKRLFIRRAYQKPSHPEQWRAEDDALLRADYPEKGGYYCAEQLKRTPSAVFRRVYKLGIKKTAPAVQVRPRVVRPPKAEPTPRHLVPIQKAAPRSTQVLTKPNAPASQEGSPRTPNANLQKAVAKAAREAKKLTVPVTADELRRLPANHPARIAYTRAASQGAPAAYQAYHEAMSQLKQAA